MSLLMFDDDKDIIIGIIHQLFIFLFFFLASAFESHLSVETEEGSSHEIFTNISTGNLYERYDGKIEEAKQKRTQSLPSLFSEMNISTMTDVILFDHQQYPADDLVQENLRRQDEYIDDRRNEITLCVDTCTADAVNSERLEISNSGRDEHSGDLQGLQQNNPQEKSSCFDMVVSALNIVFVSISKMINESIFPNVVPRVVMLIINAFRSSDRRRRQQEQQQWQQQQKQKSDTYIRGVYQNTLDDDIEKAVHSSNSFR